MPRPLEMGGMPDPHRIPAFTPNLVGLGQTVWASVGVPVFFFFFFFFFFFGGGAGPRPLRWACLTLETRSSPTGDITANLVIIGQRVGA